MVIRLNSVYSGRYYCFHGMQERKNFFFKYKEDKVMVTIPHLLITWPLPPIITHIQSIPHRISNSWFLGSIFFAEEYLFIYWPIQSFRHVQSLASWHFVNCQWREKFQELLVSYNDAKLCPHRMPFATHDGNGKGSHLSDGKVSPSQAYCFVNRESSWQSCFPEEKKSKHPSSNLSCGEAHSTTMCCVLFVF